MNLKALASIPALMTFGLGPNADEIEAMSEADLKNILVERLTLFASNNITVDDFTIYRSSWRAD